MREGIAQVKNLQDVVRVTSAALMSFSICSLLATISNIGDVSLGSWGKSGRSAPFCRGVGWHVVGSGRQGQH